MTPETLNTTAPWSRWDWSRIVYRNGRNYHLRAGVGQKEPVRCSLRTDDLALALTRAQAKLARYVGMDPLVKEAYLDAKLHEAGDVPIPAHAALEMALENEALPDTAQRHWLRFAGWLEEKQGPDQALHRITQDVVRAYLRGLADLNPWTQRHHLRSIQRVCRALNTGSEVLKVEIKLNGAHARDREAKHYQPFSPDQVATILDFAGERDPEAHDLMVLSLCTGLRFSDAATFENRSVSFAKNEIKTLTSKTRKVVTIPLNFYLRQILLRRTMLQYAFPEFGFPMSDPEEKKKATARYSMRCRKLIHRALGENECYLDPSEYEFGGTVKRCPKYGWHSFRSTFVTWALQSGIPPAKVKLITGHEDDETLFGYYNERGKFSDLSAVLAADQWIRPVETDAMIREQDAEILRKINRLAKRLSAGHPARLALEMKENEND